MALQVSSISRRGQHEETMDVVYILYSHEVPWYYLSCEEIDFGAW